MKTVLITGGSRGIGAAAVHAFAAAGWQVALGYNTGKPQALALCAQYPDRVQAFCADVSSRHQVQAMFAAAKVAFGQVDALICNAGIAQQALFTDTTEADWQRMMDVHLTGAFHCCQCALPDMIRQRFGRIIMISSMWGQVGGSCEVAYSAAKAGLIGFTKALAKEEAPSGITVNCVAPGVIDTDMMAGFSVQDKLDLAQETPAGRLGTPQDVAAALLFLASDDAAFITGQVLGVNGGLVT